MEKHLSPWVQNIIANAQTEEEFETDNQTLAQRFPGILKEAYNIVKGVAPYIIIGIAIGSLMHGFIPTGFFEAYITKENPFAVPIAVILGVPMYSNAAGVIPVIQVLVAKGVPLGTAIAFMMGVIGLSLPEAMLLKKVMNWKLIAVYFGTIAFFMILSGYLFNDIL
ncbi:putative permease [compost metagenome]